MIALLKQEDIRQTGKAQEDNSMHVSGGPCSGDSCRGRQSWRFQGSEEGPLLRTRVERRRDGEQRHRHRESVVSCCNFTERASDIYTQFSLHNNLGPWPRTFGFSAKRYSLLFFFFFFFRRAAVSQPSLVFHFSHQGGSFRGPQV